MTDLDSRFKGEQERREKAHEDFVIRHHEEFEKHTREGQALWRSNTRLTSMASTPRSSEKTPNLPELDRSSALLKKTTFQALPVSAKEQGAANKSLEDGAVLE